MRVTKASLAKQLTAARDEGAYWVQRAKNETELRLALERDLLARSKEIGELRSQLEAAQVHVDQAEKAAAHEVANVIQARGDLHQCEMALQDRSHEALAASTRADQWQGRALAYRELLVTLRPEFKATEKDVTEPGRTAEEPWQPDECRAAATEQLRAMRRGR